MLVQAWKSLSSLQIVLSIAACILYIIYKFILSPYWQLKKLGLAVSFPVHILPDPTDLGSSNRHLNQLKRLQHFGLVYGSLFFYYPAIWIGDPEMLQIILIKEFSNFTNRFAFTNTLKPFDKSLFDLADGDWKRVRNIVIPTFSAAKLKQTMAIADEAGNRLLQRMAYQDKHCQSIDIRDCCGKFNMEIILAAIFGIEYESKEQEEKVTSAAGNIFNTESSFLQLLAILSPTLFKIIEPMIGGQLIHSIDYLMKITDKMIQQRRRNLQAGIACRNDILQLMIEAGDVDKLTDDEIIAQAFVFLAAGYETTTNTLTFLSYILATNPDIQEKLYTEIATSKCSDGSGLDHLNNLPYLDMVLSETLRRYPPAYAVDRITRNDITINGLRIPKGIMIGIPIYSLHHDPKLWPDPEKFIPERFSPEQKVNRHPCSYLPFGSGPRNCIGMRLALLEIKAAIVKILSHVELITTEETEIPMQIKTATSLLPARPVYLSIRSRY